MGARREVIIVCKARKVIDAYRGSLKDILLVDLQASNVAELINRAFLYAFIIGQVVMGNVIHTNPQ